MAAILPFAGSVFVISFLLWSVIDYSNRFSRRLHQAMQRDQETLRHLENALARSYLASGVTDERAVLAERATRPPVPKSAQSPTSPRPGHNLRKRFYSDEAWVRYCASYLKD